MINKPIIKFKDEKEAQKYLKEWQKRLFLDDWVIKISLVDDIDGEAECSGKVDYRREYLTAQIRILKTINENAICKHCHEHILVHELLHLIIPQTDNYETIETLYWNENQHQTMEKMARSFIMAKYNLDFNWFKG